MFCHLVWNDIYNLSFFFFFFNVTFFFLENVSENLQIQGSEMQDSHKAIVKDLADVRHQAQDIYQKIGNQNTLQSEINHKHAVQKCFVCNICISFPYGWSDHSMLEFLHYQDQTSQYYTDLMNKLERMNSTLGLTLHYLDNMQSRIEEKLHMIQGYLGWAGETWHPECSDHSFGLLVGQKQTIWDMIIGFFSTHFQNSIYRELEHRWKLVRSNIVICIFIF